MKIDKEDLLRVNKGFGGNLRNDSSLDYAVDKLDDKKIGSYKKLAYLLRAILVDHPFSDGNKRTAMFVSHVFAEQYKKQIDREMLVYHITSIAKQNIHDVPKIERRMRNAIR
ncbi:MAG: Fic family protein [Candidatus Pacearchaeota archaeon]